MPTFNFYGTKADTTENLLQLKSVQPGVKAFQYTALNVRSAGDKVETITTKNDDLVVLELSNDVEWHYRADDFEDFLKTQGGASRSSENGSLEVPSFFVSEKGTRGFEETIKTKGLKIITGMVAKGAAQLLAAKMESSLNVGLHGLDDKLEFISFDKKKIDKTKPYLLFIHGTNSNTSGAFKELKLNDAYSKLYSSYEGRMLAFEHKTLSESPLKNLIDILKDLPDEIMLDVVSHSRGGIVADLLARCSDEELPFNGDELKIIQSNNEFSSLKEEAGLANAAASGKKITVSKLVRVACPAAGTVLIDSRLDKMVNVFCNLLKLIPGAAACMPFTIFLDFAKAVVKERTDIEVFPGLEAQIPDSPLMRILNSPNRVIHSELFVISGDVERSGILNSMLVLTTNLYFGEAHDLVVNSNSMFKGTYRETKVREHFEQESSVNHFNYFKNKTSQDALLAALIETQQIESLYELIGATKDITIVHKRGVTGKKPAVFILPGIMGSNLEQNLSDKKLSSKQRLWLNYFGIATGILKKLNIEGNHIEPTDLNAGTYNDLINYLSPDFDVYPFPFDWRMDLMEESKRLASEVQKELDNPERTNKEFHFIAHSMGGLVFRGMIHQFPELWKKISASKKTKVLMMGVPNEGSYGTIRILLGKDSVIKKLALLDLFHSKRTLLNVFKNFPGVVQLLPNNAEAIFDSKIWKELEKANNEFTGVPPQQVLKKGKDFYHAIQDTDYDNEIFRYIAGKDDSTPVTYSIRDGKIVFMATSQGDGRVLWSTIPSTLSKEHVYYVAADHGGIPSLESAFAGYKEILQKGKTQSTVLSNAKPYTRGGASQVMPDSDFVTIPTENELNNTIIGTKGSPKRTMTPEVITVSFTNGDLVHSKYPVLVGHFKGDGIIYAEKYLDRALDYKLSEYHQVNNYPGDIGTNLVVLRNQDDPSDKMICNGGVVAGLGDFGSLSESRLLVTLTQALLTLAIKENERVTHKPEDEKEIAEFGISSLLVGSDFAGLRISNSVKTILQAVVQANEKLETMSQRELMPKNYRKINHVEIIEIYQHKSIQAARVTKNYLEKDGFSNFKFAPPIITKGSGALKVIPDEVQDGNWHRLEISILNNTNGNTTGHANNLLPIHFTSVTDKAHADEETLPTNRLIVESMIEKVSKHAQWNKVFSETLYELLIPNEFKGFGSNLRNLVLMVDEQTARYPWELLQDANGISEKPMVIVTGIIRQLKSSAQRDNVIMNNSNRALVIGNPFTEGKYPPLAAAEKEANEVLKIFTENGLDTVGSIGEQDIDIVPKLLTKSYKIIHIASHGIVGKTAEDQTGIIIGKEFIFTAGDFDRIRIVPEFVFINCCSSNDYEPDIADQMRMKYDLAASVGTQLIQMGVKAAIVTGWEIEDEAAALFSATIYQNLFAGNSFGESVREAREATYNQHGQSNTWGAYQCYGDPFYTFKTAKTKTHKLVYHFVDDEEVLFELDNFISQLSSGPKRKNTKQAEVRIEAIIQALQPEWKQDGRIVEKLAKLYKSINLYEKSLIYYEQLFSLEHATYTVQALEEFYNISVRHTIEQFQSKTISAGEAKKKVLEAAEGLKNLRGETLERISLIAASYRRLFDIDSKDIDALINAAAFYRKAFEYSKEHFDTLDYYPFFNWLNFAAILSSADKSKKQTHLTIPKDIEELCSIALENANKQDIEGPNFYHKTAASSYNLYTLLSEENKSLIEVHSKNMLDNFQRAWSKDGNSGDKESFISYIEFIISILKQTGKDKTALCSEKISALKELVHDIG